MKITKENVIHFEK